MKSREDFLFCVGCAMLDSLKLLTNLCNECWASDSQIRSFRALDVETSLRA